MGPIRNYDNFHLEDNGNLIFKSKGKVISFGNINDGLLSPLKIRKLGVGRLELMGFTDITYKDVKPSKYKDSIVKFRKLDADLNAIKSCLLINRAIPVVAMEKVVELGSGKNTN